MNQNVFSGNLTKTVMAETNWYDANDDKQSDNIPKYLLQELDDEDYDEDESGGKQSKRKH